MLQTLLLLRLHPFTYCGLLPKNNPPSSYLRYHADLTPLSELSEGFQFFATGLLWWMGIKGLTSVLRTQGIPWKLPLANKVVLLVDGLGVTFGLFEQIASSPFDGRLDPLLPPTTHTHTPFEASFHVILN